MKIQTERPTRFFIKSYGCQMNSYDTQRMEDSLLEAGYKKANAIEDADVAVFNTCCIREKAGEKLFSDLGRLRLLKEKSGGDCLIAVTGCISQFQREELLQRAPYVAIILGPQDIQQIASGVREVMRKDRNKIIATTMNAGDKFRRLSRNFYARNVSESLTIQEGCDNFCTYCVVPFSRGRGFSRPAVDVISEAKKLMDLGVKEIILLGQNVNSYSGEGSDGKTWNLHRVLLELAQLDGLKRLRYITSHPKDIDENMAKAHSDIDILAPSIHLPVQSGSDDVLAKMNRRYSADEYLKCVEMLRKYRPDMAVSSDFIVGFPGETETDFQRTLRLIEEVKFSQGYSFKYSPRPNTAAAKMEDQTPESIKSERLKVLQALLNRQQQEFNHNFVGKRLNVLLTKVGKHKNQLSGRSEYSQAVSVCATNVAIGDIVSVMVTGAASYSLLGAVAE
ncbi:MAG: tRNA (N6-isopentenyl adenosine(37)-C2)-methylthiotransferase MiaB [Holosporaceae bacterium]|jgi:tRNA-2-methylthio-N6-dimethylallyladenosine synthase|nr:tRNA (N6-isopentenyl adenosine(37)-C2)-methylthiotransferase MiaB [Holosporaceae bacterium]